MPKDKNSSVKLIGYAILVVLAIVLPFVLPTYYLYLFAMALISIIATLSFRFITLMGEWSFAHAALMGVGAYTCALLTTRLEWSFWVAAPLGVLATTVCAAIISFPLIRTRFFFFFLSSFAIGEAIRSVWIMFPGIFGGHYGLSSIPRPTQFIGLTPYYFFILVVTLVCAAIMYWLEISRFGYMVKACGQNEVLTQHVGISSRQCKIITFVVGSSFAGVAGVLLAHMTQAIAPAQFGWNYMLYIFIFMLVGGRARYAGPIIGVFVLQGVSELLRDFREWVPLIYGLMLVVILITLPGGLVSLLHGVGWKTPAKLLFIMKSLKKPKAREGR